jgi:hypothetical protein
MSEPVECQAGKDGNYGAWTGTRCLRRFNATLPGVSGIRAGCPGSIPQLFSAGGGSYAAFPLPIDYRVQDFSAEHVSEDAYEPVLCVICKQVHVVNPATGAVLGEGSASHVTPQAPQLIVAAGAGSDLSVCRVRRNARPFSQRSRAPTNTISA